MYAQLKLTGCRKLLTQPSSMFLFIYTDTGRFHPLYLYYNLLLESLERAHPGTESETLLLGAAFLIPI
jgi:hypothetical protein